MYVRTHIYCRGFINSQIGEEKPNKHPDHAWQSAGAHCWAWPGTCSQGQNLRSGRLWGRWRHSSCHREASLSPKKRSQLAVESHRKCPKSINFWFHLFLSSSCHFPQFKLLDFPLVLRRSSFFQPISPLPVWLSWNLFQSFASKRVLTDKISKCQMNK